MNNQIHNLGTEAELTASPDPAGPGQPLLTGRPTHWLSRLKLRTGGILKSSREWLSGAFRLVKWPAVGLLLLASMSIPVWRAKASHTKPEIPARLPHLPVVAMARVGREDLFNEVTIPAEFKPYAQVELHAKVSGYVEQMNVDIGERVKAGQLLAKLEVPELKDELDHALASLRRAEADYADAHLAYTRLLAVDKAHPNLVAQQELDSAQAKDRTTEAAIAGAKADVERYQTMVGYTRITAPFDGVVTYRYADPGTLIQAGTASATQSLPLVRVSDNYKLRLDFPVSVAYVKEVQVGDTVSIRVQSLGEQELTGTILRFAYKVDDETRTMVTEIEVPNKDLKLMPGMYAQVVLKVDRRPQALTIPTDAVSAGKKSTVYVLNADQALEERAVTLGLETPTRYEVKAGLKEGDLVLVGNRSTINPGEKVEAKLIGNLALQ